MNTYNTGSRQQSVYAIAKEQHKQKAIQRSVMIKIASEQTRGNPNLLMGYARALDKMFSDWMTE